MTKPYLAALGALCIFWVIIYNFRLISTRVYNAVWAALWFVLLIDHIVYFDRIGIFVDTVFMAFSLWMWRKGNADDDAKRRTSRRNE